jgi:septum formation inhibitor MinC
MRFMSTFRFPNDKENFKRLTYLVLAALVAMVLFVPSATAQGENIQQALQRVQDKVQQAQAYIQSPEGQQDLQEAQDNLHQLKGLAQEYLESPEGQQAIQQVQEKVQAAQQYMDSPEGQQALQEVQQNLQQAQQQFQKAREGAQERMQEVTTKMEKTSLVKSGGAALSEPGLLLPAAALLVGGGILGYAVLRRRR